MLKIEICGKNYGNEQDEQRALAAAKKKLDEHISVFFRHESARQFSDETIAAELYDCYVRDIGCAGPRAWQNIIDAASIAYTEGWRDKNWDGLTVVWVD